MGRTTSGCATGRAVRPGTESWMESTVNLVWLRLRPAGKGKGNERKASRNLAFEPSVFFFLFDLPIHYPTR